MNTLNIKPFIFFLFLLFGTTISSVYCYEINCFVSDTSVKKVDLCELEDYYLLKNKSESHPIAVGNNCIRFKKENHETEFFIIQTIGSNDIPTAAKCVIAPPGCKLNITFKDGYFNAILSGEKSEATHLLDFLYSDFASQKWDSLLTINDLKYQEYFQQYSKNLTDSISQLKIKHNLNNEEFQILKSLIDCNYYYSQYLFIKNIIKRDNEQNNLIPIELANEYFQFEREIDFENNFFYNHYNFYNSIIESYIKQRVKEDTLFNNKNKYMQRYNVIKKQLSGKSRDIATYLLSAEFEDWHIEIGKEEFCENIKMVNEEFSKTCTEKDLQNSFSKNVNDLLKTLESNIFINFSLPDSTGNITSLHELSDKVVYINLWATWCGPCIRNLPQYNTLHSKFKSSPEIEIINICLGNDDFDDWKNIIQQKNVPGISLYCENQEIFTKYYFGNAVPRYIILFKGNIIETLEAKKPQDVEQDLLKLLK